MTAAVKSPFIAGPRVSPLTVEQYHQLLNSGAIMDGAPFELLHGVLAYKDRSATGEDAMTIGDDHIWAVDELRELDALLKPHGCYIRIQSPILVPPNSEPEPDGAIVLGSRITYRKRRPNPSEVLCAIEAADSSLLYDRTVKLSLYASAGIPLYIIINIPQRCIEVYTQPAPSEGTYVKSTILTGAQRLELPTARAKHLSIPAKRLIP